MLREATAVPAEIEGSCVLALEVSSGGAMDRIPGEGARLVRRDVKDVGMSGGKFLAAGTDGVDRVRRGPPKWGELVLRESHFVGDLPRNSSSGGSPGGG